MLAYVTLCMLLTFDINDSGNRFLHTLVVQHLASLEVKRSVPFPAELSLHIIQTMAHPQLPERLGDEILNLLVSLHHEAQSWKLATAITDQLFCQRLRENLFESQSLESCE